MKKKRLIGVITVKNNIAVQSFGYKRYLPVGKPEILAKNLDIWGVDEILINDIDRSIKFKEPNFSLLEKISNLKLSTPIIYSGGIKNVDDAVNVIKFGSDRIMFETVFFKNSQIVEKISNKIGSQGLILSLPVVKVNNKIFRYCYLSKKFFKISKEVNEFFKKKIISECLITDVINEGSINNFDFSILKKIDLKIKMIIFGGVESKKTIKKCLYQSNINAVAVGNRLNYSENCIDILKKNQKVLR
jgi:cyclase|tara:strand:- start:1539 stop:2273 length:735 start_codon:yes stop_codon:yes gene_type:complete